MYLDFLLNICKTYSLKAYIFFIKDKKIKRVVQRYESIL